MSILDQKPKSPLKEGFGTKFGIGLLLALSLSLAAFQIKAPFSDPIAPTYAFEGNDGVFTVESIMSHSREVTVDPPKPVKDQPVNIVIGDPLPIAPGPITSIEFDANTAIPTEIITEAPIPAPAKPTRYAEKMPEFPGGIEALLAYLASTPYCDAAKDFNIEGKVHVQFVVDVDGSIKNVEVLNKVFPCLDQAVANKIKAMPKWEPGMHGQRTVPVIMVAPINFKLH